MKTGTERFNEAKDGAVKAKIETPVQVNLRRLREQRSSFSKRWFVRDNFIFAEGSCVADEPVAECKTVLIAVHIACAHNAVLESAKGK